MLSFISDSLGIPQGVWRLWLERFLATICIIVLWNIWIKWQEGSLFTNTLSGNNNNNNNNNATAAKNLRQTLKDEGIPSDLDLKEEEEETEEEKKKKSSNATKGERENETEKKIKESPNSRKDTTTKEKVAPSKSSSFSSAAFATTPGVYSSSSSRSGVITERQDSTLSSSESPPPFAATGTNDEHPGLEAFWYPWCTVEGSLFRQYYIPPKFNYNPEIHAPPYNPSSQRGHVMIELQIQNKFSSTTESTNTNTLIAAYWVNYKGHAEYKATIPYNTTWSHITWIDHPWIFAKILQPDAIHQVELQYVLVHYIPYRVIPTTPEAPTMNNNDNNHPENIGIHAFTIRDCHTDDDDDDVRCEIVDPIFPYPPSQSIQTPSQAIAWSLLHAYRMGFTEWSLCLKYFTKIVMNPAVSKYRQVRQANPTFSRNIWNSTIGTAARGMWYACGFVEHGAYLELGTDQQPLPRERVQEISQLLLAVNKYKNRMEQDDNKVTTSGTQQQQQQQQQKQRQQQPTGADGSGRAGYRAM